MIQSFFLYLLAFFALVAISIVIGDRIIRSKGYEGPKSAHFDGTKFFNLKDAAPEEEPKERKSIIRWMLTRDTEAWQQRPVVQTKPVARVNGKDLTATFINHATVLVQTEGINIITDPIYSKRASPFTFIGPQRYADPGVAFDNLPTIDAVLISHNHYDHLDLATLKRLVARGNPRIYVTLGNKDFLAAHDITNVTELDWWQSTKITDAVSLTSVAAQHFSARGLSDRNKTLWGGYVIGTPHGDTYFAGDTGYGPFVDQIASHFPNGFRLGLLPVGAYKPEWAMSEVHISPDEAFTIQQKLKIQDVLAIHFGTFKLADDKQDEPAKRVEELSKSLPDTQRFVALPNGGSIDAR